MDMDQKSVEGIAIGEVLKQLRAEKGVSQQRVVYDLENAPGINDRSDLSDLENGRKPLHPKARAGLCAFYGISVPEFQKRVNEQISIVQEKDALLGTLTGRSSLEQTTFSTENDAADVIDSIVEGWARAIDLCLGDAEGHTARVTAMTLELARAMGISDSELVHTRRGALLHDLGKLGIPEHIVRSPGALTEEEYETLKQHPVIAYQLLFPIPILRHALDIPYCHHERWDGNGYPRGLKGEQIPLGARIFTVVDVFDALTLNISYRQAMTREKALEVILSLSGTHLDPQPVKVFLQLQHHLP